ncbi:MAG: TIR domain-containing protein [Lachnospiraceae bacterium]|nr:TIR domain-containing protein [Lachnospiraceae bacterium]
MKREEYEERMKDSKYRELVVTNCDSGEDYVFISYRSNSWRTVLTEIVYKLQKEYKLRIYFDKEFASETNIWIDQFIKNMDSSHCKAFLCFVDEGYVTSYATLLELMHAMNPRSRLGESIFPVSFPINWEKLDSEDWNTGLGVKNPDNPGWEEEKQTFDREFKIIKKSHPEVEDHYCEGDERENLRVCDCLKIMAILQPKNKRDYANEEAYYRQFIVDPLKKKCPSVFAEAKIPEYKVTIENDGKQTTLQIKEGECVPKQDPGVREEFDFGGWFVYGTNKEWDFSTPIHEDIKIYAKWEIAEVESAEPNPNEPDQTDGYVYTIFGQEYHAGSREQGKLMFDAFEALTSRYPEYAEQLTQRTSVAKAEDVKNANTKNADPTYFRGCKAFNIEGVEYLVGTSYGYKAKLSEIKGMFKICGVPLSEFVLNGEPLGPSHIDAYVLKADLEAKGDGDMNGGDSVTATTSGFEYTLWGISHTSNKMSDMMHDVFDLIAEKYPAKIPELATSDAISSVARKDDVDGKNLPAGKLNYFRTSREHDVNGIAYYVGTSYNRSQGIGQIERMLKLCEGSADSFVITSSPERISHSGGNTGKKGIGELL